MSSKQKRFRVAILDDYQNVALGYADWSRVQERFDLDVITEHIRTIWTGTPVELEQAAKDSGLLD